MRLTKADRLAKFTRALLWLVSRSGTTTLGQLSDQFFGSRNKTVVNLARALVVRGWAECVERVPDTGVYIPVFDRVLRVTPAGRVWNDYLINGTPEMRMGVSEMLTRIAALEKCLAPFAEAGVHCRTSRGPDTEKMKVLLRRSDLELAADLLHPYNESVAIYPWTPDSKRPQP